MCLHRFIGTLRSIFGKQIVYFNKYSQIPLRQIKFMQTNVVDLFFTQIGKRTVFKNSNSVQ